jgi:ATP-dependent DNA ligase
VGDFPTKEFCMTAVVTRTAAEWRQLASKGDFVALAHPSDGPVLDAEYAIEPKFDGWRLVAVVGDEGEVHLYARSGQVLTGRLPHVAQALEGFPPGTVFDGEAVALVTQPDGGMRSEWNDVQSVLSTVGGHAVAHRITYVLFDLIAHAGIDARRLPYVGRRKLLEQAADKITGTCVVITPAKVAKGAVLLGLHEAHLAAGFEGSVLKPLNSMYVGGKRKWPKWKPQKTREFVIIGFKPGDPKKGWAGLVGAVIFGAYDAAGNLVEVGRCSGFDMRTRLDMTHHPERWTNRVIEVAHFDPAKQGGKKRSPQMKRVRPDRDPKTILVEA